VDPHCFDADQNSSKSSVRPWYRYYRYRIGTYIVYLLNIVATNAADSDPSVFGLPGSGSISHKYEYVFFYHQAKIFKKSCFLGTVLSLSLPYHFVSSKNDLNVPSKSNNQIYRTRSHNNVDKS
jgi:hypothetical protein